MAGLDAHARPPESIRSQYKRYQKLSRAALASDPDIFDARRNNFAGCLESSYQLPIEIRHVMLQFLQDSSTRASAEPPQHSPKAYEHPRVPGLIIIPSLLPANVQLSLLDKLLHRDLSHPDHKTNLHLHYNVAYPPHLDADAVPSFFSSAARDIVQFPKDPTVHKPLTTAACLNKKFRWVTLGGQYDWTEKLYPSTPPPPFPDDVASLVQGLFPSMKAEAAIVNLYSPGDTLSLHRDVSEMCDRDLVSISMGCDGIFIAGLGHDGEPDSARSLVMRLRSGDAVLMSGPARYAWHGVPQIVADTCPEWMQDWPAKPSGGENEQDPYEHWRAWMQKKRINLNVRQMWD